jgi:crossover junction endodeoxyribonuclease RusA
VTLALILPLPPGVNNQYLTVGRRRVLSAPAKAFHRDVVKLVEGQRRAGVVTPALERAFGDALLGVYLTFFFATPHKRDLDGGLKIALDALGRALGFDDRAVVDLHLTKKIDPLRPRVEVEIETILDWEFDRTYVFLGDPAEDGTPDDAGFGRDAEADPLTTD